ncbi:MAG TPA: ECF-type sigma factor [Bryobacteraceae bacterium]|nr:ECF-type sigma factor [Bryobacteraceae bacterium]
MPEKLPDITQFLRQWSGGDAQALEQLMPMVYTQLRVIAESQIRRERDGHTLQPTALVNELYLRLAGQHSGQWKDRAHFFTFAAMMMRRILTDYARQALRDKRGGVWQRVPLSDDLPWLGSSLEEVLSLDRALAALEESDARKARVLELRVLLGCTSAEAAGILEISKATADREWTLAKAWLFRELAPGRRLGVEG